MYKYGNVDFQSYEVQIVLLASEVRVPTDGNFELCHHLTP